MAEGQNRERQMTPEELAVADQMASREVGYRVVRVVIQYALAAYLIYELSSAITQLAGKKTEIVISKGAASLVSAVAGLFAAFTAFGWAQERILKRRYVADTHAEKKELEAKIDPKRTSSKLTKSGKTRKEDA